MIHPARVRVAGHGVRPGTGDWVLYWMQQSQRAVENHALEFTLSLAHSLGLPAWVLFCLDPSYPGARRRHFAFMLEGLAETASALADRGVGFAIRVGDPVPAVTEAASRAAAVVTDDGYSPVQREWRLRAAGLLRTVMYVVESDVTVPVGELSAGHAWSAASIRRRAAAALPAFLDPPSGPDPLHPGFLPDTEDRADPLPLLSHIPGDGDPAIDSVRPGTGAALERFERFVRNGLADYAVRASDPSAGCRSGLSPYLHFGQVPVTMLARRLLASPGPGVDEFLEQLVVRRELAVNHCRYSAAPDRYSCLPEWARRTLEEHSRDEREHIYTIEELEAAATHDRYWNAAQREMVGTGGMHGYMRMYWGKMIIAWSESPAEAWGRAVSLNDRYMLDGRDPNGYAGIGWCFGLHDRPWPSRRVFGGVRTMTAAGLERKFDMDAYLGRNPGGA